MGRDRLAAGQADPQPSTPQPRPRVPLGQTPGAARAREPRQRKRVPAVLLVGMMPDLQQQARDWATQHADSDSAVLIGGVHLAVTLDGWLHAMPAP